MKHFAFKTIDFSSPENAIKVCSRMGWMPENDGENFIITFPDEDAELVEFIFEYFM